MEEIINSLDNWSIIQFFGGLSVILSGLIIYLSSLVSKKITHDWKAKSDGQLEEIRGAINKNNSISSSLTHQIGQNFQKLQDRRIEAVDEYWSRILLMKSTVPAVINLFYNIFSEEELTVKEINRGKTDFGSVIANFSHQEFAHELAEYSQQIENRRPFLSEKLWIQMFAYSGFIGRSVYLLIDGYNKDEIVHWKRDEGIKQIARTALNEKEFDYILSLRVHSFDSMLQLLENKILKEIHRLISSDDFTNNSLDELKKINSILDQRKKSNI